MQSQPMLRPADAARQFAVSRSTLLRWERRGYIAALRLPNGHRRYLVAELERLVRK